MYWLSVLLPLVIAFFLFVKLNYKEFKPFNYKQSFIIIWNSVTFGYIGSRINHIIVYDIIITHNINTAYEFIVVFFYKPGFKIPLGYAFSLIGLFLVHIYFPSKKDYLLALDKFILLATCVSCFGNIGCFFDGHDGCRGTYTNLPWGCHYYFTKNPSLFSLHPLQIYTSLVMFALFIWILLGKKMSHGNKFFISMFIIMTYNIVIDYIRIQQKLYFDLSLTQLVFILNCILLGSMYLYIKFGVETN